MENKKLIFGKSGLDRVVGLEVLDHEAIAFVQAPDGTITTNALPNKYWILSSEQINPGFAKLAGELHYKWGRQYVDKQQWSKDRTIYKNMGYDTFTIWNQEEAHMIRTGMAYFQGMKHQEVSVLSFDIETNGVSLNDESQVVLISNTFRDSKGRIIRTLFSYDEHDTQADMIDAWARWVRDINPSILVGHNLFNFDFPYLEHCSKHGLKLGRDGSMVKFSDYESEFRKDGSQTISYKKANCYGRTVLDTMFLAIKYDVGRKYESYGLKSIIREEGLEKVGRTFYDASTIRFHYKDPEQMKLIKAYAEEDADDALALYDLMVPPFFYMAQSIPKTFQEVMLGATGSQINSIMMRSYLQDGHSLPKADQVEHFEGGISMGNTGIYKDVHKVDVASLYPSIMIQYEVFDDSKDPYGYFAELVRTFTNLRLEYKKKAKEDKYYDDLQGAYKIFINSCYGFLGTNGLCFNAPAAAGFITETGREILTKAIEWAETNSFDIVNADTDSISYADPNCTLSNVDVRKANLDDLNSLFPPRIKFEDDGYFPAFIVFKAKNYAMLTSEGKLKLKGSAIKDSKKELALKDMMMRIITSMINFEEEAKAGEIYLEYILEVKNGLKDIKQWCSKKTLTDKIWSSPRENEAKVLRAIEGTEYKEADKIWTYFKDDGELSLMEKFDGSYSKERLYEKLYKTSEFFHEVLNPELFINYKLKRNQKLLETL